MKMRKEDMPTAIDLPGAIFRVMEWGENAAVYVRLAPGVDASPLLEGLPKDMCSCPHWGYMLEGSIHVKYGDGREETCRAGDIFYWPAPHTVTTDEDAAFLEISPKKELAHVYEHIRRKAGVRA